jgi:hypothetical protein
VVAATTITIITMDIMEAADAVVADTAAAIMEADVAAAAAMVEADVAVAVAAAADVVVVAAVRLDLCMRLVTPSCHNSRVILLCTVSHIRNIVCY